MDDVLELMSGWQKRSSGVLLIWTHPTHGTWVHGLFRMHDELGFSLADSLVECRRINAKPCLDGFRTDAALAGWSKDKTEKVIANAIADAAAISAQN